MLMHFRNRVALIEIIVTQRRRDAKLSWKIVMNIQAYYKAQSVNADAF